MSSASSPYLLNKRFSPSTIKILENSNLKRFPKFSNSDSIQAIHFSNNPITSFSGMNEYPKLNLLVGKNTNLMSFNGAKPQISLKTLVLTGSPLSQFKYYNLMALICFGCSIQTIDQISIDQNDKKLANALRNDLFPLIVTGWIITSIDPIKLYNPITKQSKSVSLTHQIFDDIQNESRQTETHPDLAKISSSKSEPTLIVIKDIIRYSPGISLSSVEYHQFEDSSSCLKDVSVTPEKEEEEDTETKITPFKQTERLPTVFLIPESALDFQDICQNVLLNSNLSDFPEFKFQITQKFTNRNQSYARVFANAILIALNCRPIYMDKILKTIHEIINEFNDPKFAKLISEEFLKLIGTYRFSSHFVMFHILSKLLEYEIISSSDFKPLVQKIAVSFTNWDDLYSLIPPPDAPSLPFLQFFCLFEPFIEKIDSKSIQSLREQLEVDKSLSDDLSSNYDQYKQTYSLNNEAFLEILRNDDANALQKFLTQLEEEGQEIDEMASQIMEFSPWIAEGNPSLAAAAFTGAINCFEFFFNKEAKTVKDPKKLVRGDDVLPLAATAGGNLEIFNKLINLGCDFSSAVPVAIQYHQFDILCKIYTPDPDTIHDLYVQSIENSNFKAIGFLISRKLPLALDLFDCINNNKVELFHFLSKQKTFNPNARELGSSLLESAISYNELNIIKILLSEPKTEVNCKNDNGKTPIMQSILRKSFDSLLLLLQRKDIDLNITDNDGNTALHIAIKEEVIPAIELLLKHPNIDVNVQNNDEETPLIQAISKNNFKIVERLCQHIKINPNIVNQDGQTALHIAIDNQYSSCAKVLLKVPKIDPNIVGNDGFSPLALAVVNQDIPMIKELLLIPRVKITPKVLEEAEAGGIQEIIDLCTGKIPRSKITTQLPGKRITFMIPTPEQVKNQSPQTSNQD